MQISDKAITAIKGNNKALGLLVAEFNKHFRTIENWIDSKDIRLTTPGALEIIKTVTGLPEEEILVPDNVDA